MTQIKGPPTGRNRGMRAQWNAHARPIRRGFGHFGGMANRREPAKAGRRLFQTIAHLVRTGIGTFHAVDPAKPSPFARARRARARNRLASRRRRHYRECQQVATRVIKHLRRQRLRLAGSESLCLRGVQPARRLHERVKAAPARPWPVMAVSAQRGIDDAGSQARETASRLKRMSVRRRQMRRASRRRRAWRSSLIFLPP